MSTPTAPTWQPLWDDIFTSRSWGTYPSENLIRFIAGKYYNAPDRKKVKILDLGAGTGANTMYLAREGFDTYAIDGSKVAIDLIQQKLTREGLKATLFVGDVGDLPVEDGSLDCIVDVNCIMCNNHEASKTIIANGARKLKTGGRIFSMGAKEGSWGEGLGKKISDDTYEDATEGPYANMGLVRFMKRKSIDELFASFTDLEINSCGFTRENGQYELTFWLISGIKK